MAGTVLVGGCFDLLHIGHIEFLEKARVCGTRLVIALESDRFIKEVKKRTPFHNQKERAHLLLALRSVDYVILLPYLTSEKDYLDLVLNVNPEVIAVTEGDRFIEHKRRQAKVVGAKVRVVSKYIRGMSTTKRLEHATKK